ncbi:MAG: hypothetical protein ACYS74_06480 [Planctomycetota bacterium]|jgi:hypothetical protein
MVKQLVRLWERPSYDGRRFRYYLLYTDEQGRRRQKSLGHTDWRKAERQRAQFERKLVMGVVEPGSMTLRDFVEDSVTKTGDQIRESTRTGYLTAMRDFVTGRSRWQRRNDIVSVVWKRATARQRLRRNSPSLKGCLQRLLNVGSLRKIR